MIYHKKCQRRRGNMRRKIKKSENIYQLTKVTGWKALTVSERIKIQKILIMVLLIIIMIALMLITQNILQIMQRNKQYQQYEAQLLSLQKQEEEKQAQIEAEKERIRQEKIPKLTDVGKENMKGIYRSETKRAFLTFDDGPSSVTPTILDVLKQENIPATFFVLGSRVEAMPDIVKRMYEEGHYIANHGYSHVYSSIYASPQSVIEEYNRCNDVVKNAIQVPEYQSHLFRFPGGSSGGTYADIKTEAIKLLEQNGVLYVDWNALTGDAEKKDLTIEYEITRLQQTVANKSSVIILMHDASAKKVTAEALPQIIAYLREQGYEFKNFYEIIK